MFGANRKVVGYLDVFDQKIKLSQKDNCTITPQFSTEDLDAYKSLWTRLKSQYGDDVEFLEFNLSTLWPESSDVKEIIKIADKAIGLKLSENETEEQKKTRKLNNQKKQ
ncbi:unnamed protein product [Rhizopus stolonifer]